MQLLVRGQFMAGQFFPGEFALIEKLAGCAAGELARFRFGGFHFNALPDTSRSNTRQTALYFHFADTATMDKQDSARGCAHGGKLAERDSIAWGGGEDTDSR